MFINRKKNRILSLLVLAFMLIEMLGISAAGAGNQWAEIVTDPETGMTSTNDDQLDFVILLDCTGSLRTSDPDQICDAAAKMFIDLVPSNNARVSVIAFGNRWYDTNDGAKYTAYRFTSDNPDITQYTSTLLAVERTFITLATPLMAVEKFDLRTELKSVMKECLYDKKDTIPTTQNNSFIGGAMLAAMDLLYTNNSDNAAILLLSDGRFNGFGENLKASGSIKYTNYDLIESSIGLAAKNDWSYYTIELDCDGKNSNFRMPTGGNGSISAAQLMRKISGETGGGNYPVTSMDMQPLADAFFGIYNSFMDSKPQTIEGDLKNGKFAFSINIPEVTSETNIVITGGKIDAIKYNGITYSDSNDSTEDVYFVKNQNNAKYTIMKIKTPESRTVSVEILGTEGHISIQYVNVQDLPIGVTSTLPAVKIDRHTAVDYHAFLRDEENNTAKKAADFYKNNVKAELTAYDKTTGELLDTVPMNVSEDGFRCTYTFPYAGYIETKISLRSSSFRRGLKEFTQTVYVEDYNLNADYETSVTREDENEVHAYFTGLGGAKIIGKDIYNNNEATLTVLRDGKVESEIPMTAAEDGYRASYHPEKVGNYSFIVTAKAASLRGRPEKLEFSASGIKVNDFKFDVTANVIDRENNTTAFKNSAEYKKNSVIKLSAKFLNTDGKSIVGGNVIADDTVKVTVFDDSVKVTSFYLTPNAASDSLSGEWLINRSGDIEIKVELADTADSDKSKTFDFTVVNNAPAAKKKNSGTKKMYVGGELVLKIGDYFTDNDGDTLVPSIEISDPKNENSEITYTYSENDGTITLKANGYANECNVAFTVTDNDATATTEFKLKVENRKIENLDFNIPTMMMHNFFGWIPLPIFDYPTSYEFNALDHIVDPDGLPFTIDFDCDSEYVTYDKATGMVTIAPKKAGNIGLVFNITDSSGEVTKIKTTANVDDLIVTSIITILIIVAIIALAAFIIARELKIGKAHVKYYQYGDMLGSCNGKCSKSNIGIMEFCIRFQNRGESHVLAAIRPNIPAGMNITISGTLLGKIVIKRKGGNAIIEKDGNTFTKSKLVLKKGEKCTLKFGDVDVQIRNEN